MKTLYLLRHAKSSWKDAKLSDIDRPLNKRGKDDAPVMGKRFQKLEVLPDFIISSPAKRAFKTIQTIAPLLGYSEKSIKIDMRLYGANVLELIRVIQEELDQHNSIMLVGHNPGFTHLIDTLTGTPIDNLPTCGLVRIDFNVKSWKQVEADKGKLILFEYPKKQAKS
ncbi:MAG: histidine phosphatase family protein [Bacteroidetes bacterium]|nr:MAG: histidine phosphatase family protein [Bacteroidota bacterium]